MPFTAADRLKRMTAWANEPTLSQEEIDELLVMFSKADADGYVPSDGDWTPTYNLRAAAAEGWRFKAAKASELISSDLDGDRMSANQLFEHCQRMIKTYAASASVQITTPNTGKYPSVADE
jgi:hypothetical protein